MPGIRKTLACTASCLVIMGGCANTHSPSQSYPQSSSSYIAYGIVESIEVLPDDSNSRSQLGVGTVVGGVIGGVLGNQVGSGRGKTAATAAGALGGAVIGHEIEKKRDNTNHYLMYISLDNGDYQKIFQNTIGDIRVGDRVIIENDRVLRDIR